MPPSISAILNEPKPRRRWHQFSLRTLLLFVTVAALLLGAAVNWISLPAERQRAAVEQIEGLGGRVEYSELPEGESWLWRTLREHIPCDYFQNVVFADGRFCEDDLQCLESLKHLQRLRLDGARIKDSALLHLKELKQLSVIDLSRTQITDAGLVHLTGLTEVRFLNFSHTSVSDVGLAHLTGLTELRAIDLSRTSVSDLGLAHLKQLEKLDMLELYATLVTEAGAKDLRQAMPKCWIGYVGLEDIPMKTETPPGVQAND